MNGLILILNLKNKERRSAMLFMKDENFYYKVQKGDTLWSIASQLFRDGMCWKALYLENRDKLISGDSELIYPNELLRVPDDYIFLVKKFCWYDVL